MTSILSLNFSGIMYFKKQRLYLLYIHKKPFFTFEDPSKASVVHLIWAVEHNHVFSKSFSHVLSGLCKNSANTNQFSSQKPHKNERTVRLKNQLSL